MKFWKLFAVYSSWRQKRKAFTAPALPYDAAPGPPQSAEPVPSCGAAPMLSTVPRPWRQTRTVPRRFARASPRCQAPRHPVASHPYLALRQQAHTSHSAAPDSLCPAPLWSCLESQKQKIGPNWATFFGDCGLSQSPQSPIAARKCSENSSFMLCRNREGSAIAKKLQKSRKFCFCNELIVEA